MKNLTLNQVNVEVIEAGATLSTSMASCDFCGEGYKRMIKSPFPTPCEHKEPQKVTALICLNCVKQLATLVKEYEKQ